MAIYFITAFLSSSSMLISRLTIKMNKLVGYLFASISFLILWIISGIRYGVGTDYYYYYSYINRIENIDIKNSEYGMWLLGTFVRFLSTDGQLFIFITSFIIVFFIFYTIYKYSAYPEISILLLFGLGFYFTSLNIIRQYLAISIVIFSVKYLLENRYSRYILSITVAMMFHFSAFIALISIFLSKLKKFKLFGKTFIIISFLILLVAYDKVLPILIPNQYAGYENSTFLNEGANLIFFIIYFLITIVLHVNRKRLIELNKNNDYYILFILIGTGITLLGTQSLIIQRLASYFTIFSIIILPDLIKIIKNKNLRILVYLAFVCISIIGTFLFLSRNLGGVLPYNTF